MDMTGLFSKACMEKSLVHRGVSIGDNVFIGMQLTILKGVHIGNNVIIGANSLVNKDVPDNCVAAGNPCKVIMTLDEYYEMRKPCTNSFGCSLITRKRFRTVGSR